MAASSYVDAKEKRRLVGDDEIMANVGLCSKSDARLSRRRPCPSRVARRAPCRAGVAMAIDDKGRPAIPSARTREAMAKRVGDAWRRASRLVLMSCRLTSVAIITATLGMAAKIARWGYRDGRDASAAKSAAPYMVAVIEHRPRRRSSAAPVVAERARRSRGRWPLCWRSTSSRLMKSGALP